MDDFGEALVEGNRCIETGAHECIMKLFAATCSFRQQRFPIKPGSPMAENDPPPFDSTTSADNNTGRGLLLVVALLLTAGVMWTLDRWPEALAWLLVLTPLAMLAWLLLTGRRRNLSDWLTKNAFVIITVPLMGWLLGALLLWLLVNAVWAAEQTDVVRDYKLLTVADVPLIVAVTAPAISLHDEPGALEFSFDADGVELPAETVIVTVTLPSEMAFAAAAGPDTRQHLIPPNGTLVERRIAIVNSGAFGGLRAAVAPIAIKLCLPPVGGACQLLELPARVEGAQGFAIRRFVTSTVNQASPLILLLTVAVPLVGVAAQREFEKWAIARREQQKRAFENDRQAFLQHLCAGDVANAGPRLKAMASSPRASDAAADLELARHLLALATLSAAPFLEEERGSWPSRRVLEMAPGEPRAFVAAACLAMRRLSEYQDAPGSNVTEPDATASRDRGWLRAVWNEAMYVELARASRLAVQRDVLHLQVVLPKLYGAGQLLWDGRGNTRLGPALRFPVSPSLRTPFRNDDPAWERSFLREGAAFWGGHRLIEKLRFSRGSLVIRGAAGTGRTTLAELLPYQNLFSSSILLVHLRSGTLPEKLNELVATQLLNTIVDQPIYLGRFTDNQRNRLVTFLAAHLARNDIIDRLEERQIALGARGKPDDLDLETAGELLELFRRQFDAAGTGQPSPGQDDWAGVFQAAVRKMGYERVVFIGEASSDSSAWIKALRQPEVLARGAMHFWLFVDAGFTSDQLAGLPIVNTEQLAWQKDELQQMLEWRFEKYLDAMNPPEVPLRERRQALIRAFEDESTGLERLLEGSHMGAGSYNPRRFMKLWAAAVGEKVWGETITAADIDRALSEGRP